MVKVQLIVVLILAIFSQQLLAAADGEIMYGSISAFEERGGDHSGLEASVLFDLAPDFAGRFSGVLYTGKNNSKLDALFAGYSLTSYYHFDWAYIDPHIGIGIFGGRTFNCSEREERRSRDEEDRCIEELVLAAFPEFGIAINLGSLHLFPFVRRYFDTNTHSSDVNAYGIHIGFAF